MQVLFGGTDPVSRMITSVQEALESDENYRRMSYSHIGMIVTDEVLDTSQLDEDQVHISFQILYISLSDSFTYM